MNLFSEKELLIMIIVVGGLLIIIGYLTILDIKDYLKNKKKVVVLEENISQNEVTNVQEVISSVPPADSMTAVLEEIEILDFDEPVLVKKEEKEINLFEEESEINFIELNEDELREEAKKELERVSLELAEIENKDPFEDTITNFEIEQEENAIISLDELAKISDNLYDDNEYMQYDDGNEPITIDEVISKFNSTMTLQNEVDNTNNILVNNVMDDVVPSKAHSVAYEMSFENTANYEKLDMEMRRTNDFLNSLKEIHEKQN